VLAIIAAGNGGDDGESDDNDILPTYPASYSSPAIIAVAAQDRTGGLSSFSNFGLVSVDIAAPGTDIYGPDVSRQTVYFQDFENGAGGWTTGSSAGDESGLAWVLESLSGNPFLRDRFFSGPTTYRPNTDIWVTSPFLDLSNVQGARLEFESYLDLADDDLILEVSDNGDEWLAYEYYDNTVNEAFSSEPLDISDLDGLSGYIRFRLITDYSVQGTGVLIDDVRISGIDDFDANNPQYQHDDGTSFAAPVVTGVAAMVWSHRPDLTASQVREAILLSARPIAALGGRVATGGMVDANAALIRAESFPKKAQTIFFPQIPTQSFDPLNEVVLSASSSSGLTEITYSVVSGPGYIIGDFLFASAPGRVVVRADQSGNLSYSANFATQTIVFMGSQSISFLPPLNKTFGDPDFILSPTASSGLPVSFMVVSGPATLNGSVLRLTGAGTVTIRVNQAGDANYFAAEPIERTITISKATQTITFVTPSNATFGDGPITLSATSSSGLPVTFKVDSGQATLTGSTLTFTGAGPVVISANQPGNSNYNPADIVFKGIGVSKASQTITFNPPSSVPFGASATNVSATATSNLPVAFTVVSGPGTITGSLLTVTGPGSILIRSTQTGDANYNAAAPVERTITVANAPQNIMFAPIADRTFNPSANTLTLSASASSGLSPVTYTVTSGPATVSGNTLTITGAGSVSVQAAQAGNSNYASATALLTFTVAKAQQTLAFNPPSSVTLGDAPLVLLSSATSGLPVAFTLISGPATLTGSTITTTGAGSVVIRATQTGDANYNAATPIDRTITVAAAAQTITFAPIADRTYNPSANTLTLSASASSGLSPVTYTVTSGPATVTGNTLTITGAGSVTVQASQAGNTNYGAAFASQTFTVAKASQTISFNAPFSATYGNAPLALSATADSGLPVTLSVSSGPGSVTGSTLSLTGAGIVGITATQPGNTNYNPAVAVPKTISVGKAPLTISAKNVSRVVGAANPVLPLVYSGLLGADTPATALSLAPVAATKATAKSAPGSYPITLSGGASANYSLTLVPGTLTVVGFGGTYEALLVTGGRFPVGKLTVTIPPTALTYSGTLTLAREAKSIPVASTSKSPGTTAFVGSTDSANATANWTRTTNGLDALELALTVSADGTLAGSLDRNGEPFATLAHGARQRTFAKGQTAPGAGANTLALHPAYTLSDSEGSTPSSSLPAPRSSPLGSGFSTAPIAPTTGVMTLKGFTADGSPLTATLKPTLDDTYLLWVNPYGTRTESFLAGALPLQAHPETTRFPGRAYISRNAGLLTWQKAALPANTATAKLDKSYRAGFGPLGVEVSLDPWLPPAAKASGNIPAGTLAQRLGLAANITSSGALNIAHGPDDLDLGARQTLLPFAATLSPAGVLTATNAAATAWTIKIAPTTGAFSGSFTLRDPAPTQTKPSATVDRKVTFSGVLRQAPADDSEVATGFFLVPGFPVPKGSAPTEQPSGEIRFSAP
jgi:hypothetical protein